MPFSLQPKLEYLDVGMNLATDSFSNETVVLTKSSQSGPGTLSSTTLPALELSAIGGIADFASQGLMFDTIGEYEIIATILNPVLLSATSDWVGISPGPAASLHFTTQPGGPDPKNVDAGQILPTQPVVTARDLGGNTAISFSSMVTLASSSGPPNHLMIDSSSLTSTPW